MDTLHSPLKSRVTGHVKFVHYVDQALWYATDDGWMFPVPMFDTAGALFAAESKAIFFMRWIRKRIEFEAQLRADYEAARQEAQPE